MAFTISTARSAPASAELVGVGVFSDRDRPAGLDGAALDSRGFEGKLGTTMIVDTPKGLRAAIGLGLVFLLAAYRLLRHAEMREILDSLPGRRSR